MTTDFADEGTGVTNDQRLETVSLDTKIQSKDKFLSTEKERIAEVRSLHGCLLEAAKKSLKGAIRIGEILTELKRKCGHGQWLSFVKNHLPFTDRTAAHYIRLFRERANLKFENFSDLPVSPAYLSLARPKVKTSKQRELDSTDSDPLEAAPETEQEVRMESIPVADSAQTLPIPQAVDNSPQADSETPALLEPVMGFQEGASESDGTTAGEEPEEPDKPVFRFADGSVLSRSEWNRGVIDADIIEGKLNFPQRIWGTIKPSTVAVQQRLLAESASLINRIVGNDRSADTLDMIDAFAVDIQNIVRTHLKYQR